MQTRNELDLEALVRHAHRMRDEMIARMLRAGWRGAKRLASGLIGELRGAAAAIAAQRNPSPRCRPTLPARRASGHLAHR